jgi:hypothetical protein
MERYIRVALALLVHAIGGLFPLFQRGLRWLPFVAVASGLVAWGFYTLVSGSVST